MRHTEFFRGGNGSDSGSSQENKRGNQGNNSSDKLNMSMNNISSMRMTTVPSQMRMTVNQNIKKDGFAKNFFEKNVFIQQDLLSFINQNIFIDSTITEQQLKSPTQKQFFQILWGFMKLIDPQIKPETIPVEEIPQLMKFWNYPNQLNKNMLITLGAPHTQQHTQNLLFWLYGISKEIKTIPENVSDSQKSVLQNSPNQIQKNDMEILNQYVTKSFKRKDHGNIGLNNYSKLNSTKKNPLQGSGILSQQNNPVDEEKEAKDIADQLKQKNIQLQEIIKEYEIKIDTLKLGNKNLCLKQPDLSEVNNRIEQQQDIINMEKEIIYQLQNEIDYDEREVENLDNIFKDKMINIHELTQEKLNIQKHIQDQEYSIQEAEKKIKEIERLKVEKGHIENQINQYSESRQIIYSQIEGQINEMNQLINDYNRILNTSSELFIQCQDMQAFLNYDKIRADTLENLTEGIQLGQEDMKYGVESAMNSKMTSKLIVQSMISLNLKRVSERLKSLYSEYQVQVVKQEEAIKQINRQIDEKKNNINELDIKINQLNIKTSQKQEELKSLVQQIQDRQGNFKHKSEEYLQANANLNQQINQLKQQQFNLENNLTNFMNQIEIRKKSFLKEREESQQLLENQISKILHAKQQIITKFQQLHSYYRTLNSREHLYQEQ